MYMKQKVTIFLLSLVIIALIAGIIFVGVKYVNERNNVAMLEGQNSELNKQTESLNTKIDELNTKIDEMDNEEEDTTTKNEESNNDVKVEVYYNSDNTIALYIVNDPDSKYIFGARKFNFFYLEERGNGINGNLSGYVTYGNGKITLSDIFRKSPDYAQSLKEKYNLNLTDNSFTTTIESTSYSQDQIVFGSLVLNHAN